MGSLTTSETLNAPPSPPADPKAEAAAEIAAQREAQAKREAAAKEKADTEAAAKAALTKEVDVKLVKEQKVSLNGKEYTFPAGRWTRVPRGVFDLLRVTWGAPDRSQYNEYMDAADSGTLGDSEPVKSEEPTPVTK